VRGPSHDLKKATVLLLQGVAFGKPLKFLIDSGAERSVFPHALVPSCFVFPTCSKLVGVDGTPLKVYGHFQTAIGVKSLRRDFKVNFVSTETRPILGADFLTNYGLQLNMKERTLTDPLTGCSTQLIPSTEEGQTIRVAKEINTECFIEKHCPSLLLAPDYFSCTSNLNAVHTIETTGSPVYCKPRPLSPVKFKAAKAEFDTLLAAGIVRPSNSPWASPLHMVKKGDGSWRPCGDYRKLNTITVPDRYPVPNIQSVHNKMEGCKIFSRLDLVKAYHFIRMNEADIGKTAIATPFGTFEYLRMPFGLRNASSTFQRYVDGLFRTFANVVTYIDDILIFSASYEEHEQHLLDVLHKLESVNLRINKNKSILFQTTINFLGYQFSETGIKPMAERVKALTELPPPGDNKELQRYIGMFSFYQRCMPHFSETIKPLRELLRSKFCWTDHHQKAFSALKDSVKAAVELNYPSSDAVFTITADASSYALGACLHQVVNGVSTPLCFFSRKMSEVEQRYSTFDRELLAIYSALKKWKEFVAGSQLTIFTDHKPLVGAVKSGKARLSDRQQRQLSFINEMTVDIIHIAGKENIVADTLSRSTVSQIISHEIPSSDLIGIARAQKDSDIDFSTCKPYKVADDLDVYCETSSPNPRPYLPNSHRKLIFNFFHNLSHSGIKATTKLVGSRYYWPTLKPDVQAWCKECTSCQQSKVDKHTHRPLGVLPCPTQRFTTVHLDIVGPLVQDVQGDGSTPRYLLTMIDSFTRWIEVFPLSDITANSVCKAFMFNWVARFGPPVTLISDRGKQFCSELMLNLSKALGINPIRTSAYNPKANGMIERVHRCLKAALMARNGNWLQELPVVLMGLRCRPDEDGSSPYSRTFGEQPMLPRVIVSSGAVEDINVSLQQLHSQYKVTRGKDIKWQGDDKLKTSQFVWMRLDRVKRPLEAPYQGPFKVLDRHSHTYTIEVKGTPTTVAIERLKPAVLPKTQDDQTHGGQTHDGQTHGGLTHGGQAQDGQAKDGQTHDGQAQEGQAQAGQTRDGNTKETRSGRKVKFAKAEDFLYY